MTTKESTKSKVSAPMASPKGGAREGAVKVGIIGGAGYTGGELIRLLINHPHTSLSFIHSRSNAGKPVYSVHQDLLGDTDLQFTDEMSEYCMMFCFFALVMANQKNLLLKTKLLIKLKSLTWPMISVSLIMVSGQLSMVSRSFMVCRN